jgi:ATP-dependent Clp protease protease subunit
MPRHSKDTTELFHDYGIHVPTRTIILDTGVMGEEDEDDSVGVGMAMRFIKNFHILRCISPTQPITVLMNTVGGNEDQGMVIYDLIKSFEGEVTIEVVGSAMSMGCIILQAADHRIVHKHSRVMFHTGFMSPMMSIPDETLAAAMADHAYGKVLDKIIFDRIVEKQPKLTMKKYSEICTRSKYLVGAEAVEYGLADLVKE